MAAPSSPAPPGRVASLHVHPDQPGAPMREVDSFNVIADEGVADDPRYFRRRSRETGMASKRQVTLIEREVVAQHATALGLGKIPPGAVRSNIETEGLELNRLSGHEIEVGDAVLLVVGQRDPCSKMDAVAPGLRGLMENGRQGVLARAVRSGKIQVGDAIRVRTNAQGER